MKLYLALLLILISSRTFGQDFEFNYHTDFPKILEQTKDKKSPSYYPKLLARFQKNDTTLSDYEVLSMLIGFTGNKYFSPYSYISDEREIAALNDRGNYREAIAKADSLLAHVPVSQEALLQKGLAYYALEDVAKARVYFTQFGRIMDAMALSGEGTTPETALFSLGPADGQNFIRVYVGRDVGTMGSGYDNNGDFVDILQMVWEDEETGEAFERTVYFQIEHAVKTMFGEVEFDMPKEKNKKTKE